MSVFLTGKDIEIVSLHIELDSGHNSDAFPTDPAASVDTDEDGMPDDWNPGKTDSTTGLVLDAFPDDPDRRTKTRASAITGGLS